MFALNSFYSLLNATGNIAALVVLYAISVIYLQSFEMDTQF